MPPQRRSLFAVAIVFMSALAAGAVWCLLVLQVHRPIDAIALPIAWLLGHIVCRHGYAGSGFGAAIAVGATGLAIVYARCLIATAEIAQTMGMSLRDALGKIGPDFAFALARSNLEWWSVACYAVALIVAAWMVVRRPAA